MNFNDQTPVLLFRIAAQEYAFLIDDVVEVAAMVDLVSTLSTHPASLGAANRHGAVLPMVDLRVLLGHTPQPPDAESLFIVVQHDDRMFGLVVDEVKQVIYLPSVQINATAQNAIRGIITYENRLIQVLALHPLVSSL
ncbi:MAG: hypothetical protein OHK0046_36730 [Anaerolineae bacterium]